MSWKIYSDQDMKDREELRAIVKCWGGYKTKKTISDREMLERRKLNLPCDNMQTTAEFLQKQAYFRSKPKANP